MLPLENLALSPQCGFASTMEGNLITEDDQWAKLRLVAETARQVWANGSSALATQFGGQDHGKGGARCRVVARTDALNAARHVAFARGRRTGRIQSIFIAASPTTFQNCSRRVSRGSPTAITPEESKKRYDACQRALDKLAAKFRGGQPGCVVIVGNDQRELFPTKTRRLFWFSPEARFENIPETEEAKAKFPPGIAIAEMGHCPPGGAVYTGHPIWACIW